VAVTVLVVGLIFDTAFEPELVTQMLVPSYATPAGLLPTGTVAGPTARAGVGAAVLVVVVVVVVVVVDFVVAAGSETVIVGAGLSVPHPAATIATTTVSPVNRKNPARPMLVTLSAR